MNCSGIAEGLLLIAFGVGYLVTFAAKKGDKGQQFLGYFVGTLLMLLSLLLLIKTLYFTPDFLMPNMMIPRAIPQVPVMHRVIQYMPR